MDAWTGAHLWADRFDKSVADLFAMQDEIVSRLAHSLNAQLIAAEAGRAERLLHPSSMDLYFRGRASLHQWAKLSSLEYLTQGRRFFEQAVVLDPKNVYAIFGVAAVDVQIAEGYYSEDPAPRLVVAEEMMVKTLPHVLNVALAHEVFGQLLILTNRAAYGIAECERALALDRNLASAHALIGKAKSLMGRGEETESHINEALRLCPHHQYTYYMLLIVGDAKLQLSADAEAVNWLRRKHRSQPHLSPHAFCTRRCTSAAWLAG